MLWGSHPTRQRWHKQANKQCPPTVFSNWKTGRCCSTWFLTADTSVVRTQYFVVDRTKPCVAEVAAR